MFRLNMIILFFGILNLPAAAFQVEVLDTKTSAPTKTTGNEVRQKWTIEKKDKFTIKTIKIELGDGPVKTDWNKINLSCIYDGKNGCDNIMVDAEEITDSKPLSVVVRTPFVGRYVLRVHTRFTKIVQEPKKGEEGIANSNSPIISSAADPIDVYDVVIERDPAVAAYSIGQLPNLSVTGGNIVYGDNAAIHPVFRITANGSVATAKLTSILTAIPMVQDGKLPSLTGDTVLKCLAEPTKPDQNNQTNCAKMRIDTVTAAQPANFTIKLSNFFEAGKYKINFEVTDPLSKPISSSFELTVRKHWSMAFILILTGVLAAFIIKQITVRSLPAQRRRLLVAAAGSRLSGHFESISNPDDVTKKFAKWLNSKLIDASDGLGPEKLDDEQVILLSELPDLFASWHHVYERGDDAIKANLSDAATGIIGYNITRASIDKLKAGIKAGGGSVRSARLTPLNKANSQFLPDRTMWQQTRMQINRAVTSNELAINMFVFLIATISGVTALWSGNAVWGMSGDYVTAFFWGAGAKAVTDGAVGYLGINAALRSNLGQ